MPHPNAFGEYLKGYGKDVDKLSARDIGKLVVSVFEKVNKNKKKR